MDVICRARTTDPLSKIKRLLKKRTAETKPKVNSLKNSSAEVKPPKLNSVKNSSAEVNLKVNSVKNSSAEVNPKVNSLKNVSLAVDKITTETEHKKRKSEASLECPLVKRSKVDHCQGILTKLMKHKCSMPFLHPVDRDASGNYFQVIKHPMDFGTIKKKLQQNKYLDDDEFEADVRRIFANATLYHPSNNWVHIYATKLSKLFDILWLSVKPNLTSEPIVQVQQKNSGGSTCNKKDNGLEVVKPDYSTLQASRVAKLKARFADTILRAQSKIGNPTRIDAEAIATEVASQIEAEKYKLKKQREQEREAARASLEQMERSITLDDNLGAMRDLEVLMGSRMQAVCHVNGSLFQLKLMGITKSPLEQLGLFIKPEYQLGYEDDDDLFIQGVVLEDGEILN